MPGLNTSGDDTAHADDATNRAGTHLRPNAGQHLPRTSPLTAMFPSGKPHAPPLFRLTAGPNPKIHSSPPVARGSCFGGYRTTAGARFCFKQPVAQPTRLASQLWTLVHAEWDGSSSRVATPISGCMTNVQPSPPTIMSRSDWRSADPSSDAAPEEAGKVTVVPS